MSRWPVPYSCGSFLCLPRRSGLREAVGEGLTFSCLSPVPGVAEAPASPTARGCSPPAAQPVPHHGAGHRPEGVPQTCCPLSEVPHICLAVPGSEPCFAGSWLCAGSGAQPGLGGTALPLQCSASHSG